MPRCARKLITVCLCGLSLFISECKAGQTLIYYLLSSSVSFKGSCVASFGVCVSLFRQNTGKFAEVSVKYSRVRSAPDSTSSLIILAKLGDRFPLVLSQGSWLKIEVSKGFGWIKLSDVKVISHPTATKNVQSVFKQGSNIKGRLTVTGNYARVRSAPNSNAPFIQLVKRGQTFDVLSMIESWYEIDINGKTGWINRSDISSSLQRSTAPPEKVAVRETVPPPKPPETIKHQEPPAAEFKIPQAETATSVQKQPFVPVKKSAIAVPSAPKHRITSTVPSPAMHKAGALEQNRKVQQESVTLEREKSPLLRKRISEKIEASRTYGKYAQIISGGSVKVLEKLSPDSPVLGMAPKGSNYPILQTGDSWCKISYKGKDGWIERQYIEIVEKTSSPLVKDLLFYSAVIISAIFLIMLIRFVIIHLKKIKESWFKTVSIRKNLLIIAKKEKNVQRYLTNTTTTLQKCFSELGFQITVSNDLNNVSKLLIHFMPDVIVVDWKFENKIHETMENILYSKSTTVNILVIFYNVPDPEFVQKSKAIPNSQYLGLSFSDREIFRLITPIILTGEKSKNIRKSVEASALEGNIDEGNLSEVFQFVEIGHKTGCLIVETKKPYGMIYFKQGIIVYASTNSSSGKEAVLDILNKKEGRFSFVIDKTPPEENCALPTLGILMEWTQKIDETDVR